jgi:phage terminase large subunit-like protein
MVEATLRVVDDNIAYTAVHATRGKIVRAEPVAALYAVIKAQLAAAEAGRPKAEPAPGSLEYQALHPDWKPQED